MDAASLALSQEDEMNCEDIIGQQPAARLFSHRYRRPSSPMHHNPPIPWNSRNRVSLFIGVAASLCRGARCADDVIVGRLSENRR